MGVGIFTAASGGTYAGSLATSTDGVTWNRVVTDIYGFAPNGANEVSYTKNQWFAYCYLYTGAVRLYTSTDGINWGHTDLSNTSHVPFNPMIYDSTSGLYIGCESIQGITTSTDALNWSNRYNISSGNFNSICHGSGGNYVAVDRTGHYALSTNHGMAWSSGALPVLNGGHDWYSVCWSDTALCYEAVMAGGAAVSTDGVHWSGQATTSTTGVNQVIAGPNIFVAVGNGNIMTNSISFS